MTGLGRMLVLALPLLAFPLSWLPRAWAHFRYDLLLPLPEVILTSAPFLASAVLLRTRTAENERLGPGFFLPCWAGLPLLAVLAAGVVSIRFSDHSFFGLGLLPRLVANITIFLLAASTRTDRVGQVRKWWMAAAVIVAVNGLLRLRSEPEFISTFGNWNFLGVYLAASVVIGISIGGTWSLLGNLVLVAAMWWCGSRGAWLSLGAVAMLWFLTCGDRLLRRWPARAIVVVLAFSTAGLLARPYVLREWHDDVRPMIWKGTIRMIAARPILGHGLGTYVDA